MSAMGLVALGTVADVVPLVDENRILVRHGLVSLKHRPTVGLAALMKVTELDQKSALASEDIAFTLAPRLNAAGRFGQAQLGVELLTTESTERATALAEYIHQLNTSRDSLERSIYLAANKQAKEQFDPEGDAALVLGGVGWHPGVIGIVAGRLAEKYHRPVVVVGFDQAGVKPGSGSARSAGGLDLHQTLARCGEHLLSHGGHAAAAGLRIEETRMEAFRAAFPRSAIPPRRHDRHGIANAHRTWPTSDVSPSHLPSERTRYPRLRPRLIETHNHDRTMILFGRERPATIPIAPGCQPTPPTPTHMRLGIKLFFGLLVGRPRPLRGAVAAIVN